MPSGALETVYKFVLITAAATADDTTIKAALCKQKVGKAAVGCLSRVKWLLELQVGLAMRHFPCLTDDHAFSLAHSHHYCLD